LTGRMYKFIDTNETSAGVLLPAEALKINGEYIENLIDGYRTLSVEGREALSSELSTYETGTRDGAGLLSKRYPARTIIIKYQLITKSAEEFREAYNKLASILNVEEAELIFNDEQDKFFTGTPSAIGSVEPGKNAVVGEFEILCTNPFKYSVVEYEATPDLDDNSILIDYNGTYKAFPVLEADFYSEEEVSEDGETETALTGNGDCGYVAFFNENEKIIQLGDPDEVDTADFEKSQTLINQTFKNEFAWGSAASALWTNNGGFVLPSSVQQAGSVAMGVASYIYPETPTTSATLLTAQSKTEKPYINYKVVATTSGRTANTVKVKLTITSSLAAKTNFFGRGFGLKGVIDIGGKSQEVTLKSTSDYWKGQTGHTVNVTVTVEDLEAADLIINDIKFKVERTDSTGGKSGVLGETKCNDLPISPYAAPVPDTYYLTPSNYGVANGKWHGPAITRTIPADASEEAGANNFLLSFGLKMCIGSGTNDTRQLGAFQVQITDENNKHVLGLRVMKSATGKTGKINTYANGRQNTVEPTIDLSQNKLLTATIQKTGSSFKFTVGNITINTSSASAAAAFGSEEAAANAKAYKITFAFLQHSVNPALSYNGLYNVKFVKNNCDTYKDIPNKFSTNDILEADCESGKVYLNGVENASLGALGNDWEGFYLKPGLNQIGFSYSDWVAADYAPSVKVRYREVFL